jgi:hypothetical protein
MKILKIAVHNFLGLAAFKSGKLGKLNRITGDNGVGKTSVLKAIKEAFKSSGIDPQLINLNGDKAEIMIELTDDILIERTITAAGNSPKVTVKGQPVNKPQTWLNNLIGPFIFDPTAFFMAKDKERVNLLLKAMPFQITISDIVEILPVTPEGIDFSEIDQDRHGLLVLADMQKLVYERRHEVNLDVTRKKKSIEQDKQDLGETPDAEKFKGFDLDKAVEELSQQREHNNSLAKDEEALISLRRHAEDKEEEIGRLKKRLEEAEAELEEINVKGKALADSVKNRGIFDTKALQDQISAYNDLQETLHRLKDIDRREGELESDVETHKALDAFHKVLVNEAPKQLLSRMELPIEDLEIKGDQIFIKGISADKLSTSEQMRLSIKIARCLAGELKVICIDRFETLGAAARKAFIAEASKDKFEYFITEVTEGPLAFTAESVQESKPVPEKRTAKAPNKSKAAF